MGDVKKKKSQIELKMETTMSEMTSAPDGINGTLELQKEGLLNFQANRNDLQQIPREVGK